MLDTKVSSPTDAALTVLELEPGEFHWIIMEPVEATDDEFMSYRPVDSSSGGYPSYAQALAHGSAAMRLMRLPEGVAAAVGARVCRPAARVRSHH